MSLGEVAPDLPPQLVRNALSISGLFDLAPLRQSPYLQSSLQLTPAQVRQASPARLPPPPGGQPLWAVVGSEESDEFLRHTLLIRTVWGPEAVPMVMAAPGLNHFSVLEALGQPDHAVHGMALALLDA